MMVKRFSSDRGRLSPPHYYGPGPALSSHPCCHIFRLRLGQVVTAEKQEQANLIRRREKTAATRSLLNTAS